jgi:hypothetical protein
MHFKIKGEYAPMYQNTTPYIILTHYLEYYKVAHINYETVRVRNGLSVRVRYGLRYSPLVLGLTLYIRRGDVSI